MREFKYEEVEKFPCANLIRGLHLTYKGHEMYFPKVYIGESSMKDFDIARSSIEYQEAPENNREQVAVKKTMSLCSRLLLKDGYAVEDHEMQEKYALRERVRAKILRKIRDVEDEMVKVKLENDLLEVPSLDRPLSIFPTEREVLPFSITNLSGEGVLPVDNIRVIQAFQALNMFEEEEVEDFLDYRKN